ncbi:hypothetical protein AB0L40_00300 [Patulibacter sp. NPDC049589]|uniref:hypothetical protein n=1 Tax=Patulibacter sp. NPDC049589 TaxID=3154731 RepID=UPI00343F4FAD
MHHPDFSSRPDEPHTWDAPGRGPVDAPGAAASLAQDPAADLPTTRAAEPAVAPAADADPWPDVVDLFFRAAEDAYTAERVGSIGLNVWLGPSDPARADDGLLITARGGMDVREGVSADTQADIHLRLQRKDLARLATGRLRTAMAIAGGRATYDGPVRQFLRVLPMVQAVVRPPVPVGTNTIHDGVEEIS